MSFDLAEDNIDSMKLEHEQQPYFIVNKIQLVSFFV